jgi:hypothetical protein
MALASSLGDPSPNGLLLLILRDVWTNDMPAQGISHHEMAWIYQPSRRALALRHKYLSWGSDDDQYNLGDVYLCISSILHRE